MNLKKLSTFIIVAILFNHSTCLAALAKKERASMLLYQHVNKSPSEMDKELEKTKRLLEEGADPNYVALMGNTSTIHRAAFQKKPKTLRLLAKYGANFNEKCYNQTPLFEVFKSRSIVPVYHVDQDNDLALECAKVLIENGANPDLKDELGNKATEQGGAKRFPKAREYVCSQEGYCILM